MNVGIAVHHYDLAEGTGGYAVELVRRIARHHKVTLYTVSVRAPVPDGVEVVTVPALRGRAYATILSFPLVFAWVRRRHDLVHAQGWVTGDADVVTAHIVLRAWREAAAHAGIRSPLGERTLGGFVERREQRLYRRAAAVIAPSAKVRGELDRCYGRRGDVTVVHHAFPSPVTRPTRDAARAMFDIPADAFLALYVGDPRKGLDPALDAVARTPGTHLLVVSRSASDAFAARASSLGLDGRFHWRGLLTDPSPAYAAADVLLHPTIYDSFGLVVAEAMALGIPAVVTEAAGISELITHGVSGWIVGPGDVGGDVATALAALRHDPALRQRLAQGARARAAARTWDDVALETLAVYERVAR